MTPNEYNDIINAIEWFYAHVPDWEQTRYWELFKIIQRLGGPRLFKLIVNDYIGEFKYARKPAALFHQHFYAQIKENEK